MNHTRSSTKNRVALAGLAAAVLGTTLAAAPAAQAAARDGKCDSGEFCVYFNSNQKGSVSDFKTSIPDYGATQPGCFEYRGPGKGKGKCVKNEGASVWNRTSTNVTVFFNSNYAGAAQAFPSGRRANFSSGLKNQNASHRIGNAPSTGNPGNPGGGSTTGKVSMSSVLYKSAAGGTISAGFDGYNTTPGRHEGIDFTKGLGVSVYNLVAGTVTRVTQGARGGSGLSQLAIYDAKAKKTVIYLHLDPLALRVGQSIKKGQKIGVEDYRGVSSSSAAHTHVEMRPGKQTSASKSVGDPNLDNPNPTSYWASKGYNVK